jgi:hypothetical protein
MAPAGGGTTATRVSFGGVTRSRDAVLKPALAQVEHLDELA